MAKKLTTNEKNVKAINLILDIQETLYLKKRTFTHAEQAIYNACTAYVNKYL